MTLGREKKCSRYALEVRGAICDIRKHVRAACNRNDALSKRGIDKHGLQRSSGAAALQNAAAGSGASSSSQRRIESVVCGAM